MLAALILGLLLGMQHALEADHLAAVASLAARETSVRKVMARGAWWGLGHTTMLLLATAVVLLTGRTISHELSNYFESLVGIMLTVMGGALIWRLLRNRVHFHRHQHGGSAPHIHAHSHAGEQMPHRLSHHDHPHATHGAMKAYAVGLVHGLAGSAALIVVAATAASGTLGALAYVAVFGVGSLLGMAALSSIIAVPLSFTARFLMVAQYGLQAVIGGVTTLIGLKLLISVAFLVSSG